MHAPGLNLTVIPGSSGLNRRRAGRPGAAGAQREIRDTVFISFNTVKTHSKSISRKLDVAIRADAVTRARELPWSTEPGRLDQRTAKVHPG